MHSYYIKKYNFRNEDFENSYKFRGSYSPIYPKLTSKELNYITEVINTLWKKFKNNVLIQRLIG